MYRTRLDAGEEARAAQELKALLRLLSRVPRSTIPSSVQEYLLEGEGAIAVRCDLLEALALSGNPAVEELIRLVARNDPAESVRDFAQACIEFVEKKLPLAH